MRRLLLLVTASAVGFLVYTPPAFADLTCTGTISAISTDENIRVPNGASCRLEGTRTDGNVLVGRNATLTALGVTVGGNIQAENHRAVTVSVRGNTRSRVDGNIQLEDGGTSRVNLTTIDGNLQVEGANGAQTATGNIIDGDLQAFGNRGGFEIRANRIHGNLQCSGNVPSPHGGGNTVSGDREGQCTNLTSRPPTGRPDPTPPPPAADRPGLRLAVLGGRRLTRVKRARVHCEASCTVRTRATLILRSPSRRWAMRVRPGRTHLAAGQTGTVRLILNRQRLRTARRLIRNRAATARIVVRARATTTAGAPRAETKRRVVGPMRVR